MSAGVVVAAVLAVLAAVMFAVAATAQNGAVADVVAAAPTERVPALGRSEWRALTGSRRWWAGISLNGVAAVVHAGALVLAPVSIVQPIGVLSVPFAVMIAARTNRARPPAAVLVAVGVCLASVAGFVTVSNAQLSTAPSPLFVGVATAAATTGALSALLAVLGTRLAGWVRCVAFAAAAATTFGLVSALMRLIALHLTSGAVDLDDVGVWLPVVGIVAALGFGGWAVQQAHAVGAPAVVLGCMTVIDPLVAVALGVTMLGEGGTPSAAASTALVAFAVLALASAVVLAQRHPAAAPPRAATHLRAAQVRPPRVRVTSGDGAGAQVTEVDPGS